MIPTPENIISVASSDLTVQTNTLATTATGQTLQTQSGQWTPIDNSFVFYSIGPGPAPIIGVSGDGIGRLWSGTSWSILPNSPNNLAQVCGLVGNVYTFLNSNGQVVEYNAGRGRGRLCRDRRDGWRFRPRNAQPAWTLLEFSSHRNFPRSRMLFPAVPPTQSLASRVPRSGTHGAQSAPRSWYGCAFGAFSPPLACPVAALEAL